MSYSVPTVKLWLSGESPSSEEDVGGQDPAPVHHFPRFPLQQVETGKQAGAVSKRPKKKKKDSADLLEPTSRLTRSRRRTEEPGAAGGTAEQPLTSLMACDGPTDRRWHLLEGRSASLSAADDESDRLFRLGVRSASVCASQLVNPLMVLLAERSNSLVDDRELSPSASDLSLCRGSNSSLEQRPGCPRRPSRLLDPDDLAVLRRSSAVSLLSQACFAPAGQRRESLFVVKDAVDELRYTTAYPQPNRLTFTQQLAFPTLAGDQLRHKRPQAFNEAEAHMNWFAKLITGFILVLVAALLIAIVYKFFQ